MDETVAAVVGAVLGSATTGVIGYWAAIKPARMARNEARADRVVAVEARDDQRDEIAVTRITEAWSLARRNDSRDRRVGLRMLRAMVKQSRLGPLASAMLDEMAQEELGRPLAELRLGWQNTDDLATARTDVDIEVQVTDNQHQDEEVDDD